MQQSELRNKFEKTIESLTQELRTLRVGRATTSLVEDLQVSAYNTKMPLKELASITTPQNNQIVIQPWDPSVLENIENAIINSDTNLNPATEGNAIRISIPPLTEEKRKEIVKEVHKHEEEAKIAVRNIREDAMRDIDKREEEKEISEDEKHKQKDRVQNLVDEYNQKIEELVKNKEDEIMEN